MGSRRLAILALALVATTACASGGASTAGNAGEDATASSRQRSNRNVLTPEDLQTGTHTNMLDAVTALRPHWLRGNGTTSFGNSNATGGVTVYVGGQPLGPAESLRSIDVRTVARATFRTTSEAQNRYGTRITTPVIDIEVVKGKP